MRYISTKKKSSHVSSKNAVLGGLAPDGGLYMPETIPKLSQKILSEDYKLSFQELAFETAIPYFSDDVPLPVLNEIVYSAYDFELPIVEIHSGVYSFELFHGPTLAFKDFAARFMSRLMGYFIEQSNENITILVATSGDTGGAVANGFLGVPGIDVVILYPKGKVSRLQEKQLTTLGNNIQALEIDGSFDDCQSLVKQAFSDIEVREQRQLGSANSINIARLIPQSFYYIYLASRMKKFGQPLHISVPCGNLGNLSAGLIAKKMGASIDRFIAATNINDTIPRFFETGEYIPMKSFSTLSNAMDVGDPSNFTRMVELFKGKLDELKNCVGAYSFTDSETKEAIRTVYQNFNYVLDPHGAVGWLGLTRDLQSDELTSKVLIETAHPSKFQEIMEDILGKPISVPDRLANLNSKEKVALEMPVNYSTFKEYLLS